jgi:23S rRNA pseudouridine1911/1915/1917 synthase
VCPPEVARLVRLVADEGAGGERLDRFLAGALQELSRARIQALIGEGLVLVDGKSSSPASRLRKGQEIVLRVPEAAPASPGPEPIPLTIVHEDPFLLVVDKPAGLVVHPGAGVATGTLVNALLHHVRDLSGVGGVLRPGIVHRLDRGTSGLMVVAKDDATHRALAASFASRTVRKEYRAVVLGVPRKARGEITASIGRDPVHRKKMSVRAPRGRTARSTYAVEERFEGAALLRVFLHTGRTHQIRVHLASIGHPVAGDPLYGGRPQARREPLASLERPALHAALLGFPHPGTGEFVSFESPLPPDLATLVQRLREPLV